MGDTCGALAQVEIEGVCSSKSPIETSDGTTWVPESFEFPAWTRVQVRVDIIQFPSAEHTRNYSRCGMQLKNPGLIAVCCWLTLVLRRRAQLGVYGGFFHPKLGRIFAPPPEPSIPLALTSLLATIF